MFSWVTGQDLPLLSGSQAEDGVMFQVLDLQERRQGREGESSHVNTLPNEEG